MIEIKPAEGDLSRRLSEKSGLFDCRFFAAFDGEELLGYASFKIENNAATVVDITPIDDDILTDGLLRSVLNFTVNHNIEPVFYDPRLAPAAERLGFVKNAAERTLDQTKLFGSCRHED